MHSICKTTVGLDQAGSVVWIWRMHPETMTIFSVFGAQDINPASLI